MAARLPGLDGVALVTGAASGIGRETALAFAYHGAKAIVLADVNESSLKDVVEKVSATASNPDCKTLAIGVDVADEHSVKAMVDSAVERFGQIDFCAHAAGIGCDSELPTADASVEEFKKIVIVNELGTFLVVRAVAKAMESNEPKTYQGRGGPRSIGRGSIVCLGSANSFMAVPGHVPYIASKFSIMGITKAAALDMGQKGVRVNSVCPSWADTAMMERDFKRMPELPQVIEKVAMAHRMAQAEEIADVIMFYCSPQSSYVTGTGLLVDAGVTLTCSLS